MTSTGTLNQASVTIGARPALKLSNDRKVTQLARWSPSKKMYEPLVGNAFGLPAGLPENGGTCPGATDFCKSCYAAPMEAAFPGVRNLVRNNMDVLAGRTVAEMVDSLVTMVDAYRVELARARKRPGMENLADVFRIHWDGDVFSANYAEALAETCRRFPGTSFWLYTRSFQFLAALVGVDNLRVYLSTDSGNLATATVAYELYKDAGVMIAACGADDEEAEALMRAVVGRNAPRCPALTGKIPLVVDKGNGLGVGACVECGLCIRGTNHVRFAVH